MVLNIKDPETDALARELAGLTGEGLTEAVRTALRERRDRVRCQQPRRVDLRWVIDEARAEVDLDARSEDEILGYGPDGMPG